MKDVSESAGTSEQRLFAHLKVHSPLQMGSIGLVEAEAQQAALLRLQLLQGLAGERAPPDPAGDSQIAGRMNSETFHVLDLLGHVGGMALVTYAPVGHAGGPSGHHRDARDRRKAVGRRRRRRQNRASRRKAAGRVNRLKHMMAFMNKNDFINRSSSSPDLSKLANQHQNKDSTGR